jgi:hypothetical protein
MMSRMGRPRAAWLTALGLLGAGWVTAHVLSYMLVVPAAERGRMMAQTGHGYFRPTDLLILCGITTLAGLALCVLAGKSLRAPSPWTLAVLPPIGFVVQEHVERLAASGAFPTHLVTEPRFLLGLLLQLPFALAALVCARFLLLAARRLVRCVASHRRQPAAVKWLGAILPRFPDLPQRSVLAAGYSERGPPLSISD